MCWVAVCDVCGTEPDTNPGECVPHFDTPAEAIANAAYWGDPVTRWTLTLDGRLICTADDQEHRTAREYLPGPDAMTVTYI
ncbi:hypothetical protein CIB93_28300 [Streptomyces sp. WZ.A104]|nr:hypothetical protein CIB93_28300 [Streptomyces sp. WZ.A104]